MNPQIPFSDETLSAFLDGELTDEERRQVEQWLEASPDARRELGELRLIGEAVRALPRPSVPADLHTSVMREVNELVPQFRRDVPSSTVPLTELGLLNGHTADPVVATLSSSSSNADDHRTSRWTRYRMPSVAAVCLVVVSGVLFHRFQSVEHAHLGYEPAQIDSPQRRGVVVEGIEDDSRHLSVVNGSVDGSTSELEELLSFSAPAPLSAEGMARGVDGFPPPMMRSRGPIPIPEAEAFPPDGLTLNEWLAERMSSIGDPPRPGEVLDFLNMIGGQAVLVEFTVVDVSAVDSTARQLEMLLMSSGIQPVSAYGVPINFADLGLQEGELVAIVIEADEATLSTALRQMNGLNHVINTGINGLVEFDVQDGRVHDVLQQQIPQADSYEYRSRWLERPVADDVNGLAPSRDSDREQGEESLIADSATVPFQVGLPESRSVHREEILLPGGPAGQQLSEPQSVVAGEQPDEAATSPQARLQDFGRRGSPPLNNLQMNCLVPQAVFDEIELRNTAYFVMENPRTVSNYDNFLRAAEHQPDDVPPPPPLPLDPDHEFEWPIQVIIIVRPPNMP